MGWITDILQEVPLSAVLREKLVEVERQVEELKQENDALRDENARLKQHQQKMQRKQVSLSDIETRILVVLSNARGFAEPDQIGAALSLSPTKSEYYTTKLHKEGYLSTPLMVMDGMMSYQLAHKGREYLIANDLVE